MGRRLSRVVGGMVVVAAMLWPIAHGVAAQADPYPPPETVIQNVKYYPHVNGVTVTKYQDVPYANFNGTVVTMDVYVPQGTSVPGPFPAVVMVHGGGYSDSDKSDMRQRGPNFAAQGLVSYAVNFRQSCDPANPPTGELYSPPELCGYIFPTQEDDIAYAVNWIRQNAGLHPEWKTNPSEVGIFGGSSGGGLAASVAYGWGLDQSGTNYEPTPGQDKPDAFASWSGPMDLTQGGTGSSSKGFRVEEYMGCSVDAGTCTDPLMQESSPLFHVGPEDQSTPAFLFHATHDPILDISRHAIPMANALEAAGVNAELDVYDGQCHGIKCAAIDPPLEPDTIAWFKSVLGPFGPRVTFLSGPVDPTSLASAKFSMSVPAGDTIQCWLDGTAVVPCTSSLSFSGLAVGLHSLRVQATDAGGVVGDPQIYYWNVSPLKVTVADDAGTGSEFNPTTTYGKQTAIVEWDFNGPSQHAVRDSSSSLGIINSGSKGPGGTYLVTFPGAGTYNYVDTLNPSYTGVVKIPVVLSSASTTTSTPVTVQWAGMSSPAGYSFTVQIKRPGSSSWSTWLSNQSGMQAAFTPDAGTGTYSFRARIKNTSSGATSGWSGAVNLSVS